MSNAIEDLSKITTIPRTTLQKLVEKAEACACHELLEQILSDESEISVDILFGNLYISIEDDSVKFRFEPSSQFSDMIVSTVTTKESPLINMVEEALSTKINNVYKDLF